MEDLSILKCKNCGGELDIRKAVDGVIECKFCHTPWSVPKKETTTDVLTYLRSGNASLDVCKFDEAYTHFQKASELDKQEPEAYFGMALASFRVQYLKDEVNDCLQPICHEISDKIFTDDKNYRKALELATQEQRRVYRKRGQEIDEIRDEFLALKKSGLDYDCFICVKVTEEDGHSHTQDYEIASSVYDYLKDNDYTPFFSERVIKNKVGAAYEAWILYALYTSECMLIVCSDEEYLQTKWVKNEYTRFMGMLANHEKDRDAITFVFNGKPIERLPNGKKIQGIDYSKPDAYTKLTDFVKNHTPEATKRREEEKLRKQREEEERNRLIKEQAKQLEEQKRLIEEQNKRFNEMIDGLSSTNDRLLCKSCGMQLDIRKAVDGVITCEWCGMPNTFGFSGLSQARKSDEEQESQRKLEEEKNRRFEELTKQLEEQKRLNEEQNKRLSEKLESLSSTSTSNISLSGAELLKAVRKAEEEEKERQRKLEEERERLRKLEVEKRRAEAERQRKLEEEKKRLEAERQRKLEEEKIRAEAERQRKLEENRKRKAEEARLAAEKIKVEKYNQLLSDFRRAQVCKSRFDFEQEYELLTQVVEDYKNLGKYKDSEDCYTTALDRLSKITVKVENIRKERAKKERAQKTRATVAIYLTELLIILASAVLLGIAHRYNYWFALIIIPLDIVMNIFVHKLVSKYFLNVIGPLMMALVLHIAYIIVVMCAIPAIGHTDVLFDHSQSGGINALWNVLITIAEGGVLGLEKFLVGCYALE